MGTLSRSLKVQRQEKKAEEPTPEKTSRTEWTSTTTRSPSPARPRSPWNSTGGSTHYHSQMATLARPSSSTEASLTPPWTMPSVSGCLQLSEVIRTISDSNYIIVNLL